MCVLFVIELRNFRRGHQIKDHFMSDKLNVIREVKVKPLILQVKIANRLGFPPIIIKQNHVKQE
jgi:hypothetical protein